MIDSAKICCQPFPEMALCSMSHPMMFASVHCISFVLYIKRNLRSLKMGSHALVPSSFGPLRSHKLEQQDKQRYRPNSRCRRIVPA